MTYDTHSFTSADATCSRLVKQEFNPNYQSHNSKTSWINIASLVADIAAKYSASPMECTRASCLRDAKHKGHPSTSIFKLD